uniref:uncharacterized protein LOC124062214 n=1 Tax=Scatophagus argus TaxID=75038 RepID=UPI001ED7CE32|nr:uncharacterized protein LOC124062214 [Scatophagus argus]
MKMMNFLFGVILGLVTVVHSTPIHTMTQDEVYREAITDGYLINHVFLTSFTTESPKRDVTIQTSQQPSSKSEESDMNEGSGSGDTATSFLQPEVKKFAATTLEVSHDQSSASILLPRDTDEGSGDAGILSQYLTTSSSMTATSSTGTDAAPKLPFDEGSGSVLESDIRIESRMGVFNAPSQDKVQEFQPSSPQNAEHGTPGWIIIVGFVVGLAALVILCVAIATRDKWKGPKQATQLETKTNSSNQQRELEMETFLHKDKPKENGKVAEYTVIPLDEFPGNYSSH